MTDENADTRKPSDKTFGLSGTGTVTTNEKFGMSADQPRPSDQAFGVSPGHNPGAPVPPPEPAQEPSPEQPQPVPETPPAPPVAEPPPGERAPLPPDTGGDPMQSGQAGEINGDQAGLGGPQVLPPEAGVDQSAAAPEPPQADPNAPSAC
jgi:hypothetical protein